MTARIYQSSPTERSFQRDKCWQTPGRREHVHGKVQPLDDEPGMGGWIGLVIFIAATALIAFAVAAPIFHHFQEEAGTAQQAPARIR